MVSNWLTPGTGSANLRAGQAIGDSKRAKNGAVIGMRAKEAGPANTSAKRANKTSTAAHLAMHGRQIEDVLNRRGLGSAG
jgi:hypothetical protein